MFGVYKNAFILMSWSLKYFLKLNICLEVRKELCKPKFTFSFDFFNILKPQEGYTLVQLHNLINIENTSTSVSRVRELPLFRHVNPYHRAYNIRQLSTFQRGVEAFEGADF